MWGVTASTHFAEDAKDAARGKPPTAAHDVCGRRLNHFSDGSSSGTVDVEGHRFNQ